MGRGWRARGRAAVGRRWWLDGGGGWAERAGWVERAGLPWGSINSITLVENAAKGPKVLAGRILEARR